MNEDKEYIKDACECGNNCTCEEQEEQETVEMNEAFVELEINKELDRLDRLYLFDDETKDNLTNFDEFGKGINQALEIAGFYTTLVSFGIPEDKAFELTINKQTIDHNLIASADVNKTSIEVAKATTIQVDKSSL